MNYTEGLPLSLYFLFASQTESVESFVGTYIAKYRFDDGHSMTVNELSFVAVYSVFHPVGKIGARFYCLI
jgi:hypothetical protein